MSKTTNKFSPEVRERAVRLVLDNEVQHPSRWQAVMSISAKIGCTPQTLNDWVKKAEVDSGRRAGIPTEMAERMKALERENRDQQLHDPGLLRREQLAPDVLERLQRGDHVGLGEGVTSSTTSVLYTAAQQTADWGAPLGPGQSLAIRIFQLSNRLGRGTPATVTLQF